jgi:hypothetical protein
VRAISTRAKANASRTQTDRHTTERLMRKPSTECPWGEANKDSQWTDKFESYLGETCET